MGKIAYMSPNDHVALPWFIYLKKTNPRSVMKVSGKVKRNSEVVHSGDPVKETADVMKQINAGVVPVVGGDM